MITTGKIKLLRKKPWSVVEDRVNLPIPRGFEAFSFEAGANISLNDFTDSGHHYNVLRVALPVVGTKAVSYDFILENWSLQL